MPLSLKIPPLVLLALFAVLALGLAQLDGGVLALSPWLPLLFAALAVLFLLPAALGFLRAGTTVDPRTPERSQKLVTRGLYRVSRNPMYVAFVALLLAWALYLGSALALCLVPAYGAWLQVWQIRPEERALRALFGAEYDAYCRETRRWL